MQKLIKIELEYEDGTVLQLTGRKAEYAIEKINVACSKKYIHGLECGINPDWWGQPRPGSRP